jgi:UDP-N-acetylglucosamine 1-carboxyvinyltransferase
MTLIVEGNLERDRQEPTAANLGDDKVLQIAGGYQLSGEVTISGAKNSALVIIAGGILCDGVCRLKNVPGLSDISKMRKIVEALGVKTSGGGDILELDASSLTTSTAPYELVSKLRAAFFAIGPILARLGEAKVPLPGGCSIGARPIEFHLRGLQAMGAHVQIDRGIAHAYVTHPSGRLQGAKIYLDYPSVGATETLMMAATLADGETIIENAAKEPEIVDIANFCNSMGAQIVGAGTEKIVINGVARLHSTEYSIIPDRIEAGTFLIAGAIARSELSICPVIPSHLAPVLAKLADMGVTVIAEGSDRLRVLPPDAIKPTDIETQPHPGFPTDMQAQFMALMSVADGNSVITETVFENRLQHVAELNRLGANIRAKGNNAIITGVPYLSGAPVMATDLRASAALVIAGLAARETTIVKGLHHLDRGYDRIEAKLRSVGAQIQRISWKEE